MADDFRYTPLGDALATLSRAVRHGPRKETVEIREAYDRVLAADVIAREDSPSKDISHFDGFALDSAETISATPDSPASFLLVRGAPRVGVFPKTRLASGEAMAVFTGGFIPIGADAVVPLEDASALGKVLKVARRVEKGEHVYPTGTDVRKGERVLKAGRVLKGQDLVLLASLHVEEIPAFSKPKVAIVPTGSELTRDIGDRKSGKVVESHSLLLRHLVEEAGGAAQVYPIVPDEKPALSRALKNALKRSDVVLTLAGSSVGEPDLVDATLRGFGKATSALVHGVKVHRGRVMGFAVVGGKPVVILPGPIQGALNAFIVFAYPLIRRSLGRGLEQPPAVSATIGADWEATGRYKAFDQIVYLELAADPQAPSGLLATPGSGETEKVSFLTANNAYTLVPGDSPRLKKGGRIQAHLLPGLSILEQ